MKTHAKNCNINNNAGLTKIGDVIKSGEKLGKLRSPHDYRTSTLRISTAESLKKLHALKQDAITQVDDKDIDYEIDSPNQFYGAHFNSIPIANAVQGARMFYGSKFINQAFPLVKPDVPWVQNLMDGDKDGRSFDDWLGNAAGAVRAKDEGVVQSVGKDHITMKLLNGEKKKIPIYNNFAFNRKTAIHNTPLVKKGDPIKPGQMLAKSNYTDDNGTLALGLNAKTALIPYRGHSVEDAIVVSESFAKRLAAETMYTDELEYKRGVKGGVGHYKGIFPNKFTNKQYAKLNEEGVVQPGQVVEFGDPIILATKPKPISSASQKLGKLSNHMKNAKSDASLVWDMHEPGEVTDVVKTKSGYKVSVKAITPANAGDKIVYRSGNNSFHPETEVLTEDGWKNIGELSNNDRVASLFDYGDGRYVKDGVRRKRAEQILRAKFSPIIDATSYDFDGELCELDASHAAYAVTPDHRIWRKGHTNNCTRWSCQDAQEVHGGTHSFMVRAPFDLHDRKDPEFMEFQPAYNGVTGKEMDCITKMPFLAFVKFMALYLADGNIRHSKKADHSIQIAAYPKDFSQELESILRDCGFKWSYNDMQYRISTQKALRGYLEQFGKSPEKFVPSIIKKASIEAVEAFLDIYWKTDGDGEKQSSFWTSSKRMANDLQEMLALSGRCSTIRSRERDHSKHPEFTIRVIRYETASTRKNYKQAFNKIPYKGPVFCIQVSGLGVILTRYKGNQIWIGNSTISPVKEPEQCEIPAKCKKPCNLCSKRVI